MINAIDISRNMCISSSTFQIARAPAITSSLCQLNGKKSRYYSETSFIWKLFYSLSYSISPYLMGINCLIFFFLMKNIYFQSKHLFAYHYKFSPILFFCFFFCFFSHKTLFHIIYIFWQCILTVSMSTSCCWYILFTLSGQNTVSYKCHIVIQISIL